MSESNKRQGGLIVGARDRERENQQREQQHNQMFMYHIMKRLEAGKLCKRIENLRFTPS